MMNWYKQILEVTTRDLKNLVTTINAIYSRSQLKKNHNHVKHTFGKHICLIQTGLYKAKKLYAIIWVIC